MDWFLVPRNNAIQTHLAHVTLIVYEDVPRRQISVDHLLWGQISHAFGNLGKKCNRSGYIEIHSLRAPILYPTIIILSLFYGFWIINSISYLESEWGEISRSQRLTLTVEIPGKFKQNKYYLEKFNVKNWVFLESGAAPSQCWSAKMYVDTHDNVSDP